MADVITVLSSDEDEELPPPKKKPKLDPATVENSAEPVLILSDEETINNVEVVVLETDKRKSKEIIKTATSNDVVLLDDDDDGAPQDGTVAKALALKGVRLIKLDKKDKKIYRKRSKKKNNANVTITLKHKHKTIIDNITLTDSDDDLSDKVLVEDDTSKEKTNDNKNAKNNENVENLISSGEETDLYELVTIKLQKDTEITNDNTLNSEINQVSTDAENKVTDSENSDDENLPDEKILLNTSVDTDNELVSSNLPNKEDDSKENRKEDDSDSSSLVDKLENKSPTLEEPNNNDDKTEKKDEETESSKNKSPEKESFKNISKRIIDNLDKLETDKEDINKNISELIENVGTENNDESKLLEEDKGVCEITDDNTDDNCKNVSNKDTEGKLHDSTVDNENESSTDIIEDTNKQIIQEERSDSCKLISSGEDEKLCQVINDDTTENSRSSIDEKAKDNISNGAHKNNSCTDIFYGTKCDKVDNYNKEKDDLLEQLNSILQEDEKPTTKEVDDSNSKPESENSSDVVQINENYNKASTSKSTDTVPDGDIVELESSEACNSQDCETSSEEIKDEGSIEKETKEKLDLFLEVCKKSLKNTKYEKLEKSFERILKKHETIVSSDMELEEYVKLLENCAEDASKSLQDTVFCIDKVLNFQNSVEVFNIVDVPVENEKKLKKLYKLCLKLIKRIKKLEETEVDFDDEDNSAYIMEDRYKARLVKVFNMYCKIAKINPRTGLGKKIEFISSEFNQINVAINKKYKGCDKFPNYIEIKKLVDKCAEEHDLPLNDAKIQRESEKCFKALGELLQKRRKLNLYQTHYHFIKDNMDPANNDSNLRSILKQNFEECNAKINTICKKFVQKQEEGKEVELSEDSDNSNHKDSSDETEND